MPQPTARMQTRIIKTGKLTIEVDSYVEASRQVESLALEHDAFDPDLLHRLGAALIRLERYGEAEPYLRRSLELRPGHRGTESALVHVLGAQSR